MFTTKAILTLILSAIFLFSVFKSYKKVISEPTAFEEIQKVHYASFPSFTLCKRDPQDPKGQDNFNTFDDVLKEIESFKAKINFRYDQDGIGVTFLSLDLTNASVLSSFFNSSIEFVVETSVMMRPHPPYPLIPCVTLNVPHSLMPLKKGNQQIAITISDNVDWIYLTKHEYQQSQHNYQLDQSEGFEILSPDSYHIALLAQTETIHLKKGRYECCEDNSMNLKSCLDNFIAEQLKCYLPWTKSESQFVKCQTKEDLNAFRNLSFYMTSTEVTKLISRKGCFKPNCKVSKWTQNIIEKGEDNTHTSVYFTIPSDTKVLQRNEVLLADLQTFVVDCGSYLGLFLGASVLSLTELGHSFFKTVSKAFHKKFFRVDDRPSSTMNKP